MPKIFISYARDGSHGESLAAEVQSRLLAAGFDVFRDVIGLKPGDVWYHKLEFELESSDAMVLVVSEKVRTSKWVHNEVSMAEEIGIPVIPVLAQQVRQPLWLRHLQLLDFCVAQHWEVLIDAVGGHVKHPHPNPSPSQGEGLKQEVVEVLAKEEVSRKPPIDEDTKPVPTKLPLAQFGRGGRGVRVTPSWADNLGEDQYGYYADLTISKGFLVQKHITQRFRLIKAGTFMMGTEGSEGGCLKDGNQHQVTLSKDFWLADTACTQALWQVVCGDNPSYFKGDDNRPVENVSWDDIQQFLQKLNAQVQGLSACLPTEAQWEYACRAGTETAYLFGDEIGYEQVNFNENVGKTITVKSLPANPWGMYEMHGNIWEWCQDVWQEKFPATPVTDPLAEQRAGRDAAVVRVLRGGSWFSIGRDCRSAIRLRLGASARDRSFGFRFAVGH
ncbi:MAG: SUMF1/EgtB/PvdO family nonheme iron enzyme [Thiolinea sp.]